MRRSPAEKFDCTASCSSPGAATLLRPQTSDQTLSALSAVHPALCSVFYEVAAEINKNQCSTSCLGCIYLLYMQAVDPANVCRLSFDLLPPFLIEFSLQKGSMFALYFISLIAWPIMSLSCSISGHEAVTFDTMINKVSFKPLKISHFFIHLHVKIHITLSPVY